MSKEASQQLIDISPTISPKLAVFPGDLPFSQTTSMSFDRGDHLTLSSMQTSLHLGSHTDAPVHYHKDGVGMSEVCLDSYFGPCHVIEVDGIKQGLIELKHIDLKQVTYPRVLFKTMSYPCPEQWTDDFYGIHSELMKHLGLKGVKLIGIDTPSVDPANSKTLDAHQVAFEHGIAILEGLVLEHVLTGDYELIALPLKIRNADASPVRAVLRPFK